MNLVVAKLLCIIGVFLLMMLGSLLPVRLTQGDRAKVHRSRKLLLLSNSFGCGIFLAICFNTLLPGVREKVEEVFKLGSMWTDYPLGETTMLVGFFLTVLIEQMILTFRKEKPSFIALETFNAGSDGGSDSECESSLISLGQGQGEGEYDRRRPARGPGLTHSEISCTTTFRLVCLALALSTHSMLEGLTLGLQEQGAKVLNLFISVAIHEVLAATSLGLSVAKRALPMTCALKLAWTVSLMMPIGVGIGMGIHSAQNIGGSIASLLLQSLSAGAFLFVTFFEILGKELEEKHDRLLKVLFLILGYGMMAGLAFFK
ncbi:zinc transporter ZIP1 [Callorhinchus milii]|uniref:Zinc transporter ZIP3 n=1 Tax=Callorhinchus milii TaxID=7868 RepID=V9KQV1_CALMI|nr:zinc transporter ZIP1 [Callorhinchus milii]XP_007896953.1 zinc transporter ZIP1 [Callorhinchus milii]XP_007896954.1 zinc transporter ZIP1 [Callorhinchus milii]|eukprot:gi/632961785/ref/XP_007896952.1/ PREDICTED: zinc transporter ZIP3 [Callorhinchus milii]